MSWWLQEGAAPAAATLGMTGGDLALGPLHMLVPALGHTHSSHSEEHVLAPHLPPRAAS